MQRMRLQRWVVSAVVLGVLVAAPVAGASEEVEQEPVGRWWVSEAAALENQADLKADFDGNGFADLAVGAPWEDIGPAIDSAGALSVFYWNSTSSLPFSGETWAQGATGSTFSESDDRFAEVLVAGDFNGDGVYDLAVGVPHEDLETHPDAGMVQVLYGVSGTGLTLTSDQYFHQDVSGIPGVLEEGDLFGYALAAGDFDNDGYDDLAVGAPYEDVGGVSNAGYVTVIFGSAGGLDASDTEDWLKEDISGIGEADDFFGRVLATGDFDGDGYDDLALGTPGDDLAAIPNAGSVDILFGSSGGLTTRVTNDYWHQDRSGIPGTAEEYDGFGAALAVGDFDDDGYDDLAIGVPYEDLGSPAIVHAGYVHVLYGSSAGLTATDTDVFYQGGGNTSNSAEADDQFGLSLAAGDLDNDGYDDLVVGVPMEDWSTTVNAGMVHIFWGGSSGVYDDDQSFSEGALSLNANVEHFDEFGRALAVSDFNGDGYGDLAVGVPMEDIDTTENAGWVTLLFGTSGLISYDNAILRQHSAGSGQLDEDNDRFGWAVAAVPLQLVPADLIFSDDFESGDTDAWTTTGS